MLEEGEKIEALNAHPAIGARGLSARSAAEQGTEHVDPAVLTELAYLNQVYEEKFGFRFVVFVNRRPKAEILQVLRDRIGNEPRRRARHRAATSSSRSHATAGHGLPEGRPRRGAAAAARRCRNRLDRRLVLLHPRSTSNSTRRAIARDAEAGVAGEYWGVHGGGFYHSQKYRVAPQELPEPLHWFKWEAYTTWLSGSLCSSSCTGSTPTRGCRPAIADLTESQAIASAPVGCCRLARLRRPLPHPRSAERPRARPLLAALVALAAWGAGELLASRAAYLEIGAMLGTIMAANVFVVIIPAHGELVRAKLAGREPDPRPGLRGEATLGAQQLPDPAGRLRDARRPRPDRIRARARLARARARLPAARLRPRLLQPLAHGTPILAAARCDRDRRNRARRLARARGADAGQSCRSRRDRRGAGRRRAALRSVPLGSRCAERRPPRDCGADRGSGRGRSSSRPSGRARCRPGTRRE